jgi:hypothetical protein
MSHKKIYEDLITYGEQKFPGFEIRFKDESRLMKVLSFLSFFNPDFKHFSVAVGHKVYFPSRAWTYDPKYVRPWKVLSHEIVHMTDDERLACDGFPGLFRIIYYFPQLLALLSLLSIGAFWDLNWLWWLCALVFLAPLPSPGRKWAEMRGYQMSLAANIWRGYEVKPETLDWIIGCFTGPGYYYMWPFKNKVEQQLQDCIRDINSEVVLNDSVFYDIHQIVKRHVN